VNNEPRVFSTKPAKAIEKFMKAILIITGALIILLVTAYVLTRYLFKVNFDGFEELCTLIVVWMYFIGSANASREQSHIAADMLGLFVKKESVFNKFVIVRHALGVIVIAIMLYLSFDFMWFNAMMKAKSMTYHIPMYCYHFSLFLGILLMLFYDICHLVNDFTREREIKKRAAALAAGGTEVCEEPEMTEDEEVKE